MNKLVELLNEYNFQEYNVKRFFKEENVNNVMKTEWIISKRYGFIKWLVDNDKIDKEFEDKKFLGDIFDSGYRYNNSFIEERLLCYLALTDEPIEFLCSILK